MLKRPPHNPAIPFSVATLGIFTFAMMDVLMKGLSIGLGAYNAILWRTSIALVIAGALFAFKGARWPAKANLKIHVWRSLVVSIMAFLFFWGLAYVPLAEAIALSFIAPLIALYLASALLGESIGRGAILASLIGFSGALIIIGGKLGGKYDTRVGWGIAAILLSAVMYAYNLILQRQQALVANPVEIAFFQSGTIVAVYLCFAPWLAVTPPVAFMAELSAAAILSITSVLLLSWAYARAEARILIPVEYTAFIWAAILGWLVFDERLTLATLIGTAMIVTGCLLALRQQQTGPIEHVETTAF